MRIRPKVICCLAAGVPAPANAASTPVTSFAVPVPVLRLAPALEENASSGKLVGNTMGAPGVCGAPTMQFASPGSVHSSSRVPLVSWYQTGNPLVSLIGPTALRPTVPLLCAGGGASA